MAPGLCLEGVPDLHSTPQDEASLTKKFECGSAGKESALNAGDLGSIPGLERSPGEGSGDPLQYTYLENPVDRGAW